MKKAYSTLLFAFCALGALAQSPSTNKNYTIETIVKVPGKTDASMLNGLPVGQVNRTVQYMDGLGRPIQTVQWKASPLQKDIVQVTEYDALGRETNKYLPYAEQNSADGTFKATATANQANFYNAGSSWDANVAKTPYPYSKTVLEVSPAGRVLEQGAPGAVWQPYSASISNSGHTIKPGYAINTAADTVKLWTVNASGASTIANYPAGSLYKTVARDENWTSGRAGTSDEFKDVEGRVVLKRVWETESIGLNTYYVYDSYGNLAYVVPPAVRVTSFTEADAVFKNYIYGYHYDNRKRLVEKKIPGKGWEHIVYNKLDQVVLTQDSVQRNNGQWSFVKYDALGRTVLTGIAWNSAGRTALQGDVNAQPSLWEKRESNSGTDYTSNSIPTSGIAKWGVFAYYDDYSFREMGTAMPPSVAVSSRTRGLPTGSRTYHDDGIASEWALTYYDEDGRVKETFAQNHIGGSDRLINTYNFANELTNTVRTHIVGSNTTTIANAYTYDLAGRKVLAKENINSQGEVTLSEMLYNEIGQLREKKLANGLQGTTYTYNERGWLKSSLSGQFSMQLQYHDGATPQYNGNISGQQWGSASSFPNGFVYGYDKLNRLSSGTSSGIVMSESLTYDVMGNITALTRDGSKGTYSYTGNQLDNVTGGTMATGLYGYDGNGNAITDGRNGVTLTYNYLNLPVSATKSGLSLSYWYDATGAKLRKTSTATSTVITDYVDGIQYLNGVIDFIQTEQGIAKNNGGTYTYNYNLTDNLGNVRYTFDIYSGAVRRLQEDNYYPFGLRKSAGSPVALDNKYLYNGKELQDGLEQYDYGARFYDPMIGRWNVVDPHGERYESISNYSYAFNNPARFVDLKGKDPGDVVVIFGGADFRGNRDRGGAPLILKQIQEGHLDKRGGVGQAFHSTYWGTSPDDPKSLDKATQYAYDFVLANYNKVGQEDVEGGQIIIQGYSYGGVLANHLSKRLKEAKLDVNLLVTVDAAAGPESSDVDRTISSNVIKNLNYFQTKPSLLSRSRGDKNSKEKGNNKSNVVNIDVTKVTNEHGKIDDKLLMNVVNDILKQLN